MQAEFEICLEHLCDTVYKTPDFLSEKRWVYDDGVVLQGLYQAGLRKKEERFAGLLLKYCGRFVKEGRVPFVEPRPLSLDNINNAKVVFTAWKMTGDKSFQNCLDWFFSLYEKHPRISANGGLWHKVRYPDQMWLDGLYMLHPFLAAYGSEFGREEVFEDIARQFALVHEAMYDKEAQLYYHACDFSKKSFWCRKENGCSDNFWGRSLGWLGMACVDVLEYLPKPYYDSVINVLEHLAYGILRWQDEASGVWYQLPALPKEPGNYLEASCSAMFVYTLYKGVRLGLLPDTFLKAADRAAEGILKEFYEETEEGSRVGPICVVAGLGPEKDRRRDGSCAYYLSEPKAYNDKKGYGAMILAMEEAVRRNADKAGLI